MTPRRDANGLSAAHTKTGRLQRALLKQIAVHERDGTLPTSHRFLFYELEQLGVVSKVQTGARRVDQDLIDALTSLREVGLVPWDVIEDETRTLSSFQTAPTVVLYTLRAARRAALDRWDGRPAPLILCESRSLAGVLYDLAGRHACPIAATNGHSRGFLITKVAPALQPDQRVLYLGDWDHCGHQIENTTRATLVEHSDWNDDELWERVALTTAQVDAFGLRSKVISKPDRRYRPVRHFDAVETEAFGQRNIVNTLQARLDELMPEPLDDVLKRQRIERAEVIAHLHELD